MWGSQGEGIDSCKGGKSEVTQARSNYQKTSAEDNPYLFHKVFNYPISILEHRGHISFAAR